jgi:hypothetical protein
MAGNNLVVRTQNKERSLNPEQEERDIPEKRSKISR